MTDYDLPQLNMPRIYLLRHGETVWNTEQRIQGQLDSALTAKGRRQAEQNGERLRSLLDGNHIRIISSPLGRTLATATIIASKIGIAPDHIETEDRLKEISFGDWEGMTWAEVQETNPERYKNRLDDHWNVRSPGGENYQDVAERLQSWLAELNDEIIVAISHGCAGRIFRTIHANLDRNETPNLSENHESIYLLKDSGVIEQVS